MVVAESALSADAWNAEAASFLDLSLIQTWEYGAAKAESGSWEVVRLLIRENEDIVGLCQCMAWKAPFVNVGVVWINRGPLWRRTSGENASRLLEMLRALKSYWVDERGMYLLIAPPAGKDALDASSLESCEFRPALMPREWASATVDLDAPLEQLRAGLARKWRNCLGKAERSGLKCLSGTGGAVFSYVLEEYAGMLRRKKLKGAAKPDFLGALQARFGEANKFLALVAVKDNERLGGLIIARYGRACEYLVGAVNDKGQSLNAGNYLLWQAVTIMKGMGYDRFDLGGMHPIRTLPGILHFKSGLGGKPYALIGNIEARRGGMVHGIIGRLLNRA